MKARLAIGLLALALVALGAYLVLSPFLTLWGLAAAVQRRDTQALERLVDFPRVREALKRDLGAALMRDMARKRDPFAALGTLLAAGLVGPLVDALVTPEGLASIGTGQEPGQASLEEVRNWRLRIHGWSRAFVHHRNDPSSGLVLECQGWRWRVVRLQLPPD